MQGKGRKKRGTGGEWMDRGTEVVEEAGQGELERASGTAWLLLRFEDVDMNTFLREGDGGGEAVGPGTDYGGSPILL